MKYRKRLIKLLVLVALMSVAGVVNDIDAAPPVKTSKSKKSTKTKPAPKTSAEAKKRQEETRKEIKLTEQQIRENELEVKKNLNELGKISGDISETKEKISVLNGKLNQLSVQIESLEKNIGTHESELGKLREEYLKAVKKMRVSKKNKSDLAFIFSSDNFNQALRRMRYLREFSSWRETQTKEINNKIAELKSERESLAKAREEERKALEQQKSNESRLLAQQSRQEEVVAKLKKDGAALSSHLKRKQAEANDLNSMISTLIASEEQQRREEERRKEEERKREEQRRIAAEQAEKERLTAEIKQTETGKSEENQVPDLAVASSSKGKKKTSEPKKEEKESSGKRTRRSKDKKEESVGKVGSSEKPKEYADARKRTPRSKSATEEKAEIKPSNNFADMKGSLPRPTNGSFKITSYFGRQSLPDLPDVVYDNPGIDAESTAGATALAVFKGKVSGVYLLPGYNTVVIVNHGGYYTVYGNIATPSVKVGDSVELGQKLGILALNEEDSNHSSIHFEVWKNREKLNPAEWLKN